MGLPTAVTTTGLEAPEAPTAPPMPSGGVLGGGTIVGLEPVAAKELADTTPVNAHLGPGGRIAPADTVATTAAPVADVAAAAATAKPRVDAVVAAGLCPALASICLNVISPPAGTETLMAMPPRVTGTPGLAHCKAGVCNLGLATARCPLGMKLLDDAVGRKVSVPSLESPAAVFSRGAMSTTGVAWPAAAGFAMTRCRELLTGTAPRAERMLRGEWMRGVSSILGTGFGSDLDGWMLCESWAPCSMLLAVIQPPIVARELSWPSGLAAKICSNSLANLDSPVSEPCCLAVKAPLSIGLAETGAKSTLCGCHGEQQ